MRPPTSRRTLLKTVAGAAPLFVASHLLRGAAAPSNRINLGFIGVGGHGASYNMATFLQQDDARVVAVNDVFTSRRKAAKDKVDKKYSDTACREYPDFRELIAQKDIDAVCISTPDHWHVTLSMLVADAGKHVMSEKPTLTIAEGRALVELVAKKKVVYQVGLEDRSVIQYHKLAAWVRNGAIGELKKIEVGLPSGKAYPKEDPVAPPADLNWPMWLGPAPFAEYSPNRTGAMQWRNIRDYSGGLLTDWGAHLMDTANVAAFAEESGPVEVEGEGKFPDPATSMSTCPFEFKLLYKYSSGVEMTVQSGGVFLKLIGTRGWVGNKGWRGRLEASDDKLLQIKYDTEQGKPDPAGKIWPMPKGEHRNFLDCIRSGQPTTYPAEHGHRLSTSMHIGNIAMELKRKLRWDPTAETFADDAQANQLRSRTMREDWKKIG